jgi:hypothetical protein
MDLAVAPWPRRLGLHEAAELWRTRAPVSRATEAEQRAYLTDLDTVRADPALDHLGQNLANSDYHRQAGDLQVLEGEHAALGLLLDLHDLQDEIKRARDRACEHALEQARLAQAAVTDAGGTRRDANTAFQARFDAIFNAAKATLDPVLDQQRRLARAGLDRAVPGLLRSDRAYQGALRALVDQRDDPLLLSQARQQADSADHDAQSAAQDLDAATPQGSEQERDRARELAESQSDGAAFLRAHAQALQDERAAALLARPELGAVLETPLEYRLYEPDGYQLLAAHTHALARQGTGEREDVPLDVEAKLAALRIRRASMERLTHTPGTTTPTPAPQPRHIAQPGQHNPTRSTGLRH